MPVHPNLPKENILYQRDQYALGGPGRWYWDYRDNVAFSCFHPEHKSIIDVGCGEGIALEKLQRGFPEKKIIGVDVEIENIEICREHGLTAIYADVYELPIYSGSFDACLCIDMLEHLEDPTQSVREIVRILKPGGRLVVVVPHDRNFLFARLACLMFKEAFYDVGHQRQWRPKDLANLLTSQGLTVKAKRNLPFIFWQTSLHHLIVADKNG
jgi:2-polyprenyl-3-methyl-5-hydroxy-6-metoxy-1,4-benzoquinol methylase